MDVRRLAAIDMYGTRGTVRRQRIILAEFVLGVLAMVGFGSWILGRASSPGGYLLGAWAVGAGLNYLPLALYAIRLSRPGALDAELRGIDTGREIRRYGVLQLWILVPLWLVVSALRRPAGTSG